MHNELGDEVRTFIRGAGVERRGEWGLVLQVGSTIIMALGVLVSLGVALSKSGVGT